MKHHSKFVVYKALLVLLLVLLHACDGGQQIDKTVIEVKPPLVKQVPVKSVKVEKLNLDVTDEMMDELSRSTDTKTVSKDNTLPVIDLKGHDESHRIHLKGEFLMDKSEEDVKKSVEGAVLEVEIEFK